MGQLAQKNGSSEPVRSYGQMLQKDHSDANQKATAAAKSVGLTPPSELNSKQKAMYDRMSKLTGAIRVCVRRTPVYRSNDERLG